MPSERAHELAQHARLAKLLNGDFQIAEESSADELSAFAVWATDHRLAPLLHAQTPERSVWKELFHAARTESLAAHLFRSTWMKHLFEAGASAGVSFTAFKGAGIAHLREVYAEPGLRPLGDVDLLVPRNELPAAVAAAQKIGFTPPNDDPVVREYLLSENYHVPLVHPDFGVLELHHGLYRDLPDGFTEGALVRAVPLEMYGQRARVLARPDLFLTLCVHYGIYERGCPPWAWLAEIFMLGRALTPNEWSDVTQRAEATHTAVFVCAALSSLDTLWKLVPAAPESLSAATWAKRLHPRELRAVQALLERLPEGALNGDKISLARRLAGRPVRGGRVAKSLFCHPGAVCLELNVRSDAPAFWRYRLQHAGKRLLRGVRAAWRS